MKALEDIKPNIQRCYDTLLQDFPDAAGMVRIRLFVKTENTMARVQLSEVAEPTTLLDSHAPHSEASAHGCDVSHHQTAHTQRPRKQSNQPNRSHPTPSQTLATSQLFTIHARAKRTGDPNGHCPLSREMHHETRVLLHEFV